MIHRIVAALLFSAVLLGVPTLGLAGGIKGRVVLAGAAPAARNIPITIDQYVCGNEKPNEDLVVSADRAIRNVVVWIENPPAGGTGPASAAPVSMDQKECVFIPRVVIVPAGGTVEFLNSDRLLHNLHATPQQNTAFNRTQPKGRTISISFARPEIIAIKCDLHSWMRAWVVVAPHAFHAVTGPDGRFAFDNLPPGRYTVQVWHERLGTSSETLTVPTTGDAEPTLELRAK